MISSVLCGLLHYMGCTLPSIIGSIMGLPYLTSGHPMISSTQCYQLYKLLKRRETHAQIACIHVALHDPALKSQPSVLKWNRTPRQPWTGLLSHDLLGEALKVTY